MSIEASRAHLVRTINSDPAGSDLSGLNSAGDTNAATVKKKTIVEPTDADIERLALLSELQYAMRRTEQAKAWGFPVGMLDSLVKNARSSKKESSQLPFSEVDPWPDPIDPAQLLDEVAGTIQRFIVLDDEQAFAAALWITQTWFIDVLQVAPLALINAPEKACGKSQLLDVMGRMSAKPISAANSSTAFMFRAVEKWTPTVLIDEADTFIKENEELKGLINAGHTRAQAYVGRVVGDNHEPSMFNVWGAKALAGIQLEKHLPDATMSRGIIFNLRRKAAHESVSKLRHAEPWLFSDLAAKLARFALDYSQQVRDARPDIPEALSDRDQDNWSGLLAIADCAGGEWPAKARAAALKLSGAGDKPVSTGNELLEDIRQVFADKKINRISTADLITALCEDEEAPWLTYYRGNPITARQLARQLKAYGIESKTIRMNAYTTQKGFEKLQFDDAFSRYLDIHLTTPQNLPSQGNISPEANNHGGLSVTDNPSHIRNMPLGNPSQHQTPPKNVTDNPSQNSIRNTSATLEPPSSLGCYSVTDKTPIFGRGEEGIVSEVLL